MDGMCFGTLNDRVLRLRNLTACPSEIPDHHSDTVSYGGVPVFEKFRNTLPF